MTTTPTRPATPQAPAETTGAEVGADRNRVDGPLKVTGTATYAYEQPVENPAYLHPIVSTIAKGTITRLDTSRAEALDGVLLVLTHRNAPKIRIKTDGSLSILQGPQVRYHGEFIGAVVAETAQAAREAAGLVTVDYDEEPADLDFRIDHPDSYTVRRILMGVYPGSYERGDVDGAFDAAPPERRLEQVYTHPDNFHAPIEPHPVIAIWNADAGVSPTAKRLTMYDANQGASANGALLGPPLGLLPTQIEIISPYVGGSFGNKGWPHAHLMLVSMAAKLIPGRPIKYAMTRQQMFRSVGYRPASQMRVRMAMDADGRLTALDHQSWQPVSKIREQVDQTCLATRMMYEVPNLRTIHHGVKQDVSVSTFMRGPGEYTGFFAVETALDELAEAGGIDPVELRIRNEPPKDPESGKPWSTRNLVACLREGAEQFGWAERGAPGERREGEWAIGMGVASATYPNQHMAPSRASVTWDGARYVIAMQASDIGTGARTALAQIAADALEVPMEQVHVELGRTGLPWAMAAGGSIGTMDWGTAIVAAVKKFRSKHGARPAVDASSTATGFAPRGARGYSRHAFGCHFAQVRVSTVTGETRVDRMLGVFAAGRIVNPKTARSQLVGGMTMGISGALHEETYRDPRFGHIVNGDLAGYHVAAHADIHDLESICIDEFDPWFGPMGAKGIGELGIVGVPAAIGNAIHNATGIRLRDLPFTPDKILEQLG